MQRFSWVLIVGLVGVLLFRLGNRLYLRLAGGESLARRYYVTAIGLTGAAAGLLFSALTLLMSMRDPQFSWSEPSIIAVLAAAVIVGLLVAGATAAKIFALRRLKQSGVVHVEEIDPNEHDPA